MKLNNIILKTFVDSAPKRATKHDKLYCKKCGGEAVIQEEDRIKWVRCYSCSFLERLKHYFK